MGARFRFATTAKRASALCIRQRDLRERARPEIYTNRWEIRACIVHLADKDGARFDLQVDTDEECEKAIIRRRHQVRVIGVGLFDRQDRLTKITKYKELLYTDDERQQPLDERLGRSHALRQAGTRAKIQRRMRRPLLG
ncbi:hypothetical protein [Thermomonas sp.]|uniref:hypothetical protein n=1 Tax=Thermomonas sp. TaxID=1971895 RepID=UPI002639D344|nr:hypothetical protein [Thermomonas sp.]MCO5054670.1 hypothetical protein [Thermomonas sp.]